MIKEMIEEYYVQGEQVKVSVVNESVYSFLDWAFDIDRMKYINVNEFIQNGKEYDFTLQNVEEIVYDLITNFKEIKFFENYDLWDDVERKKVNGLYEYRYKGERLITLDCYSDFNIKDFEAIDRERG
jgi:hypothetical protein